METEKKKILFSVLTYASVLLTVVIILNLIFFALGKKVDNGPYTEYSDGDYFSETTYFYTETDYRDYLKSNGVLPENKKTDTKFIAAASKKVSMNQTPDENIFIGSDNTRMQFLYVDLKVELDKETSSYLVEGTVRWENEKSYEGKATAEGLGEDFLGITWGGEGTLVAESHNMYGKYYGSDDIKNFSTREADSYHGFVWQFRERTALYGKIMECGKANLTLEKIKSSAYEDVGKHAVVSLTYIHTYSSTYGIMDLTYTKGPKAPIVNFSSDKPFRRVEVAVEGLEYLVYKGV